jgi:hypothetical protein
MSRPDLPSTFRVPRAYCSSVYEDAPDNYLVDYTLGGPFVYTGIVGLDSLGNVAFKAPQYYKTLM